MILASNARQLATVNNSTIEQESAIISINIANAVRNNFMNCAVTSNTLTTIGNATVLGSVMTSDPTYYSMMLGIYSDQVREAELAAIINQFTSLGYTISQSSNDGFTFYWNISW
jgi:predicted solute-binding protein